MKDFFKSVLATLVGLVVFALLVGIISVMSLVGMVASSNASTSIRSNSVLSLNLSGNLAETSSGSMLSMLGGQFAASDGLAETLSAIHKAKENDNIKGIYLEAGLLSADFAQVEELRHALQDFRSSGKWIVAYGDSRGDKEMLAFADKGHYKPFRI